MKIKLNCYIKHPKYGTMEPNRIYEVDEKTALELVSRKLDVRTVGVLVDSKTDTIAEEKTLIEAKEKIILKKKAKLMTKKQLIKTNIKKQAEVDLKLKQLEPEEAEIAVLEDEVEALHRG